MKLGNDADTVGAVCGQLAGAFYGVKAIPQEWLTKLYEIEVIRSVASQLYDKQCDRAKGIISYEVFASIYVSILNKYCLMNVLAMQALLYEAMGDPSTADEKLSESLALAEIGRHIRFFVDLGPDMLKLLERQEKGESQQYLRELQDAFAEDGAEPDTATETIPAIDNEQEAAQLLVNLLTNRELEIIEMFAQRMSNQEIANNLYISNNTVKRHAANIYRKLEAKNRRVAVEKASSLGFIT